MGGPCWVAGRQEIEGGRGAVLGLSEAAAAASCPVGSWVGVVQSCRTAMLRSCNTAIRQYCNFTMLSDGAVEAAALWHVVEKE